MYLYNNNTFHKILNKILGWPLAHPVRAFAPCWLSPAAARDSNLPCWPSLRVIPHLSPPFISIHFLIKGKAPKNYLKKKKKKLECVISCSSSEINKCIIFVIIVKP